MTKRKAVSKSLRFEVFKRDDFTCQYCGAHPPDVILHVDHINPVKLGGKNEEENLITSCSACNLGKSATPLTAVPKSLADRAAEVAEREAQVAGYAAIMEAQRQRVEDDAWRVADELQPGARKGYSRDRFNGITYFVTHMRLHETLHPVTIAKSKFPWSETKAFKYFCGICWNRLRGDR